MHAPRSHWSNTLTVIHIDIVVSIFVKTSRNESISCLSDELFIDIAVEVVPRVPTCVTCVVCVVWSWRTCTLLTRTEQVHNTLLSRSERNSVIVTTRSGTNWLTYPFGGFCPNHCWGHSRTLQHTEPTRAQKAPNFVQISVQLSNSVPDASEMNSKITERTIVEKQIRPNCTNWSVSKWSVRKVPPAISEKISCGCSFGFMKN